MPTYQITAPDGRTYRIDGPAGATEDQVRAEVLKQNPNAGTRQAVQTTPDLPTGTSLKETLKGAAGEVGKQAMGVVNLLGEMGEMTSGIPRDTRGLEQGAQGAVDTAKEVIKKGPRQAAIEAGGQFLENVLTTPKTPQQAQERGASLVRGAETVIPGGTVARDLAKLGGVAGARAVAGAAERVAARGETKAAEKAATVAEKNDLIRDVRGLGLRLTPQDAGGAVGRRVAAAAGRPQLEREISQFNAPKAKAAAAADVGIKEPLSIGAVTRALSVADTKYKAPRKLGRVELGQDQEWKSDLEKVRGITVQEKLDFPEDYNEKIEKEIAKFDKPSADADTLVSKIRKLRERASDNFRGNAEDKELAGAQRQLADAMERAIERHGEKIGQSGVIKDFREARTQIAKLLTIKDALTETGELDLSELQRRLDRNEPLTGNLRTLARAKSSFDRSFQNPEKIREHPVGALDIVMGGLAAAGKGGAAALGAGAAATSIPLGVAAVAARPVTRAILGSRPYQAAAIKPRVPKPSLAAREARKIAQAGKREPLPEPTLRDIEAR